MKSTLTVKILALVVGGLSCPALALGAVDLPLIEKGRVHHSVDVGGRFEFPLGSIIYQAEADEQYSKGYRPASSRQLEGNLTREIYDLPAEMRSRGGFVMVRDSLKSSGFEIMFECARDACGKPDAWALYLSPLMRGSSEAQYYLAAKAGDASFVGVYAKEVGGQTRILVDHILVDQPEHGVSNSDVASFEFSSGSSVVSNSARKHLASLAERIRRSPDEEKFVLVGHADQSGSLLRNLLLSGARAQALRKTLLEQYGVSSNKMAVAAHGYSNPQRVRVGALDRRVQVLAQLNADQLVTQDKVGSATE